MTFAEFPEITVANPKLLARFPSPFVELDQSPDMLFEGDDGV